MTQTHPYTVGLVLLLCLCGCQQVKEILNSPETQDELSMDLADVTELGISQSDDPAKAAARVIRVATQIKAGALSDVNASDLRAVITEVALKKLDKEDQPKARAVINLIFRRLKRHANIDLTLVPAEQLPQTRALVVKLCDSAIVTATPYLGESSKGILNGPTLVESVEDGGVL